MLNKDDGFSKVGAELEAVHVKRVTLRTNEERWGIFSSKQLWDVFHLLVTHMDGGLKSLPQEDW